MKILCRILFLLCLPPFLLSPISTAAFYSEPLIPIVENGTAKIFEIPRDEFGRVNPWVLFLPENLSIDRYFTFIDLIENEAFLETLTEEEFDIIVDFVTRMVYSSVPESMEDLKEVYELEIDELMDDLYGETKLSFSLTQRFDFEINPAICLKNPEFSLCKGWIKRKSHHFGHWCKKHKTPLIAGAVVVGVVTVAVLTGGVGGSSAAAVGGALIEGSLNDKPSTHINKPGEVFIDDGQCSPPSSFNQHAEPQYIPLKEPTSLEKVHILTFEKTEQAKHDITEVSSDKTPLDKVKHVTKTIVSNIVHDVFESVCKIGTYWHELHPNSTPEDARAYKEYVATQHAKIDEIFGTYYPNYTIESQEYLEAFKAAIIEEFGHYPEMQMGELPPPGALVSAASRAIAIASRTLGVVARSGSAVGSVAAVSSLSQNALTQTTNNGLEKLVSHSESKVLKTAINQNKHIKMVRDYLDKPAKEIQKGINSYEKQITIHEDKIVNPIKYYPDWDKLDPKQREALVNKKWPAEIKGYEEQRDILQSILNERLSYE